MVEDEKRIATALKEGLEQEAYAVDLEHDGEDGLNAALAEDYDLLVLDVMLPSLDGFSICKQLRSSGKKTPILILTAKSQDVDTVKGLDGGADDYLTKPFSFDVLLARIRALLRRPAGTTGQVLAVADLTLDPAKRLVARADKTIDLSQKEYALLEYLMRNSGKVLSKNNIMSHVWDFDADILPNTVEVFIGYLRSKVDKGFAGPNLIQTVRGFGYKIEA